MPDSTTWYPNPHEQQFAEWARSEGWHVTKQGWPDFICRRGGEVMAVEVKGGNDGLRSEQIDAIRDLRNAGMPAYMWTPEHGLSNVVRTSPPRSVLVLESENASLRRLIARAYNLSMEVHEAVKEAAVAVKFSERLVIAELSERCRARHSGHQSAVPNETMNVCSWVWAMREAMTVEQMSEVVGMEVDRMARLLDVLNAHAARFKHSQTHKLLQVGETCSTCGVRIFKIHNRRLVA